MKILINILYFTDLHISEANIAHKQDNIDNRNIKTAQLIQLITTLYMMSLSYVEEKQDIIKPETIT